jgi:hypothetical protein
LLLATAGCGAAGKASNAKCVSGSAGSAASGQINTPREPSTGVDSLTGKCWASIKATPIAKAVIRTPPSGSSADFKTAWSPKYFYVWAHVHTGRTSLINTNTSAVWQDDTVEVYLGTNDHAGAYQTGDGQIDINSGGMTSSNFGPDHADLPSTGAQEAEKQTAHGYTVWLEFPIANIGVSAKKGAKVGFTIGVDWPDSSATKRIGQTMWVGNASNSGNDAAWGTATLA